MNYAPLLEAIVRFFHLIAVLVIACSLIIELVAYRPMISRDDVKNLRRVDTILMAAFAAAALFGATLWLWVGKPSAFYTGNPVFHAKLTLFALLLLLLIYPSVFLRRQYRRHRNTEPLPEDLQPSITVPGAVRWPLKLGVPLLIALSVLAYLMARGIGY